MLRRISNLGHKTTRSIDDWSGPLPDAFPSSELLVLLRLTCTLSIPHTCWIVILVALFACPLHNCVRLYVCLFAILALAFAILVFASAIFVFCVLMRLVVLYTSIYVK